MVDGGRREGTANTQALEKLLSKTKIAFDSAERRRLDNDLELLTADDSLVVLSVRDALGECEAAAAIIQRWLADERDLAPSDIGIIIPSDLQYGPYLAETLARGGLAASSLPVQPSRRSLACETVLLFLQCRRRPAPAMALASLYCSPLLCWPPDVGLALAKAVMAGEFYPPLARGLEGASASLFALIRSATPGTNQQLAEQLRAFQGLLSDSAALAEEVFAARKMASRISGVLAGNPQGEGAELDKAMHMAAAPSAGPNPRSSYLLGGISVMLAHETPKRNYRRLLLLGFNDGA